MGVLEQVMDLKGQGVSENEIIGKLSERGISPNEISEALNQARIKSAVSSENSQEEHSGNEGLEPSIMGTEAQGDQNEGTDLPTENISDENLTPPSPSQFAYQTRGNFQATREMGEQEEYSPQQSPEYSGQYQDYSPEYQQGYDYGAQPAAQVGDADTMIEIAEQVFFEKIKSMQKQLEDLNEFKILSQAKMENISERLRRIESSIDRLQAEILERVGSYGSGVDSIKKEMEMMQDSFGKVVGTLADRAEHHAQHNSIQHHTQQGHQNLPTQHLSHKTSHKKPSVKSKARKTAKKRR